MITGLEIERFKCFRSLFLSFGHLTLLTGYNGAGKSTALQPLLLLAQGLRRDIDPTTVGLNGPLVSLGTAADIMLSDPRGDTEPTSGFTVLAPSGELTWSLGMGTSSRSLQVQRGPSSGEHRLAGAPDVLRHLQSLSYVSAVRQGTWDAYPVPDLTNGSITDVGTDGRFAAYHYDQAVDDEVAPGRCHPAEPATSLRKQLDAWLSALFPGARANVQKLPPVAQLCLQFQLSEAGSWRRPANVGYGLTFAFPILVALLVAQNEQVIVIDSPEAHLHPYAQSQMGRLLAQFASAGVQILVETHSDHLLNGVRLAVRDRVLSHDAVRIFFFTGATPDGHGVISPALDPKGSVSEWPDGFFDQSERDLSRLAGWT